MEIFRDFFAANGGKGLQIAARVSTPILLIFTNPGGLTTPKTDLFVYSGGLCPPIFFLSGFLGGIQKGSETLFSGKFLPF